jgi:hypothetical protein
MKRRTSLSLDSAVLDVARQTADSAGVSLSSFAESALLDRIMRNSARIAADYERSQGRTTEAFFAAAEAEREAMAAAIRESGQ